MNKIYLNGKDTNIDCDFFYNVLRATPDTYNTKECVKPFHSVTFETPDGKFSGRWKDTENVLKIECIGVDIDDTIEQTYRLSVLENLIDSEDWGEELEVMPFIVRKSNDICALEIFFYERDNCGTDVAVNKNETN